MAPSRLITLIIGLCVVLGLMIWLVGALQQFYWQISYYTNPILANLLLFLLVVLTAVLIAAFVYYVYLMQKPTRRRRRTVTRVSEVKTEAAQENLRAIQQQVSQIQDKVARQALLEQSQAISANLERGEIQVVVFGTGSAGKTSIINGLIGQMVGQVGAPMGTTTSGETYTLNLPGMSRAILITDTPGILEAGVAGTERDTLARQLATQADLLIFVVDNDLQRSQYEPLQVLATVGKRSLVVLNKADLFTDDDRETILEQLRLRLQGVVPVQDVLPISANPQTILLETGEQLQPEPDLMPLIRRMAAVLRAEGEDLVADNILLQSQRLGETARRVLDGQRRRQADKVIDRYQWIGAGVVAATPLPVLDLLAAAAVNAQMVVEIGKIYGCDLNMDRGRDLAVSLAKTLTSLGIVRGAIELLTTALQLSVGGFVIGRAVEGVSAAYLTRIAGKSFIEYFRQDQDWGDGGITEVVQRQFQLNRRDEFMKAFIQDAIAKVVKPLTPDSDDELDEDLEPEPEVASLALPKPKPQSKPYVVDDWKQANPIDDW